MVLNMLNNNNVNLNQNATVTNRETLVDTASSHEKLIGIERRVQKVKELFKLERDELTTQGIYL